MSHFDFQMLDREGAPTGQTIRLDTIKGVILACPTNMSVEVIEHICGLAQKTPDYPHDICQWSGNDPSETLWLKWSARIFYRLVDFNRQAG